MKKVKKRILSLLLAVMTICAMLPVNAMASENDVARIGGTGYSSLDAAVKAAADGDTIELLRDAALTSQFTKGLTFTGNGTVTLETGRWDYPSGKTLTFTGNGITFDFTSTSNNWLQMCLGGTLNVENGAECIFRFDSKSVSGTTPNCGIYMNSGAAINVADGSSFKIYGQNTNGVTGQAIQLDVTGKSTITVTGGSEFLIDGTNRGYVNSPEIYVEDSSFTVQNCTNNASNGGKFTAIDSKIVYKNNRGHGLSTSSAVIMNSDMEITDNGYCGFANTGELLIDGTSKLDITGNGWNNLTGQAAFSHGGTGLVESGAAMNISDNYCAGIYVNMTTGSLKIEDGVDLDIVRNGKLTESKKRLTTTGGGIWNIGTLSIPSDAVLYNNHADTAGDDIYNAEGGTITFGQVGSNWLLDGAPDCRHVINGWYDDSKEQRWNVEINEEFCSNDDQQADHYEGYTGSAEAVTGLLALKAAHDKDAHDKTSYPGLEKYILDQDGTEIKKDSINAGDSVKYELKSNVPQDLTNYLEPDEVASPSVAKRKSGISLFAFEDELNSGVYYLTFHDELDPGLTVDDGSVQVHVNGTEIPSEKYELEMNASDGCAFELTLDLVSLYRDGYFTQNEFGKAPITVTYTAIADSDLSAGVYRNTAWAEYEGGDTEKDEAEVDTYGIDIFKYDQSKASSSNASGLGGAKFKLVDEAGNEYELVSKSGGHVKLEGLKAGRYTLTETEAPSGYVKSDEPLTISLPEDADSNTFIASFNFANAEVPHTGGAGTRMFTIIGAGIAAAAGALFIISRRKKEKM